MPRKITIDCELCGTRIEVDRAKEVLFEIGDNSYHVMDLCPNCLDVQLKRAESVNDTRGMRQRAAALVRLPGREVPTQAYDVPADEAPA